MEKLIKNLESVQREFNKILVALARDSDLLVKVNVTDTSVTDLDGNKINQHIEVKTEVSKKLL